MILFVEGLYLRTGDPAYKALAKRWSKVALIIFAVGVVTGTILSFEFGLLWPEFMATFGEVFGLAFGLEGISFFLEAIFIAIYVYGWDRLSPRAHFLTGIPIVITGFTGSFTVIAVNGWMNNPQGFDVVDGQVVNPRPWEALLNDNLWHELIHMYLAGYIVAGFIVAGVYARAWLRGPARPLPPHGARRDAGFAALAAPVQVVVGDWAGPHGRREPADKLAALEGLVRTEEGAPFTIGGFYDEDSGEVRFGIQIPKLLSLLADHDPNATRPGPGRGAARGPPAGQRSCATRSRRWSGSARGSRCSASLFFVTWLRKRRLPRSTWFFRAVMAAGPLAVVALIAGWVTTEVGRQPWIVYG